MGKAAASRKRTRAGHELAIMEMMKEQKMFRSMREECKTRKLELRNEQLKLHKEAGTREERLTDVLLIHKKGHTTTTFQRQKGC